MPDESWQPVSYDQLSGWKHDDHSRAFEVFKAGAGKIAGQDTQHSLHRIGKIAQSHDQPGVEQARGFFEEYFTPHQFVDCRNSPGFVTGYFEPEVKAFLHPSEDYCVPLYRRPDDLVSISDANRPEGMSADRVFGRTSGGRIEPYFDRLEIQSGALDGKGLELVWLKDKTDAFFIHVQGSARLVLPDGDVMRIAYAAKNGHPYTSIGRILADQLNLPPNKMTADMLARWMRDHPQDIDGLMAQNRSYIFFQIVEGLDLGAGPIGAAGLPLAAGRSLAIDCQHHAYGLPVWVNAPDAEIDEHGTVRRLMIAQDTGSAIKGPQRGDLFVGSGDRAGYLAGKVRSSATFHILVPTS